MKKENIIDDIRIGSITVFSAMGSYWAYTDIELKRMGELPIVMTTLFTISREENESEDVFRRRVGLKGKEFGVELIHNL